MKPSLLRTSFTLAAAIAALCGPVAAEDIDLFTSPPGVTIDNPNVIVFIDNSANWDAANQHWISSGGGPYKQGQSELRALYNVTGELADNSLNMGLMFFTPGPGTSPNGGYVRFHVRNMNSTNKAALRELIGTPACVNGANSLNGTPNCIFNNFATPAEKQGTAKSDYSGALFDVFKYLGGFTDPANSKTDIGQTPIDATHFGPARYARNGNTPEPLSDPSAYSGVNFVNYNPPANSGCQKSFLVFVGNGFPSADAPCSLLQGIHGINNCTTPPQLAMPQFTIVPGSATVTLGTDSVCKTPAQCATDAATTFPGYASYACTGGLATPNTPIGTDATCESTAQCAARAATLAPGHGSYFCSGGSNVSGQTATDFACETNAQCSARAATRFPGYSTYTCSGGSTTAGTVGLGTDSVRETAAACKTRATGLFPGWTSYACVSGTAPLTAPATPPTVRSGAVCESLAACNTRMAGLYTGHFSVACSVDAGTTSSGVLTDPTCETPANCVTNAATNVPGWPTGATASSCGLPTAGSTCGGTKRQNQSAAWSCGVNKQNYLVTINDQTFATQVMQGTGCAVGKLQAQTMSAAACLTNQTMTAADTCVQNQSVTGTYTVNVVTPTSTSAAPSASTARFADEWAKYLYTADVNSLTGQQNVKTYTIDVFKDAQDVNETALLMSMAKYGGGRYFQATSEDAILNAFREILVEIQAVNSVFAAASLPIAANNRTQNENQVFIGMFRPDGGSNPRWFGNLKQYQVALFGADAKLADADGKEAIAATTGFVQACARSFYTTDSTVTVAGVPTTYWDFSPSSGGTCTSVAGSSNNDQPDGPVVEKGATAEVLRRGNSTTALPPFTVTRTMQTCTTAPCTSLVDFNSTNVPLGRTGASTAAINQNIIDFTYGRDVGNNPGPDENGNGNTTEPRASIHGDVTHSRALPVNFGTGRGVELYYGSNDGALHGIRASNGTEKWSFIAPEHHAKLKRLFDNTPKISGPGIDPLITPTPIPKDYFFDGSLGLFQNADNSKVWIYASQRRGGRMVYGFDITGAGTPAFMWAKGCPNLTDDTGCTAGMDGIGQTWSTPSVGFIKGYSTTAPVVVFGGGYDNCEDQTTIANTCGAANKGNHVYILDAQTGAKIKAFDTDRAVSSDVTFIDRDFDGNVDHIYVADMGGGLYRIDLVDPGTFAARASGAWTITKIAATTGGGRKFMFGPASLATATQVFLTLGTGDRERPLKANYPYSTPVVNRFYMFVDKFPAAGTVNLDGATMNNFTSATSCTSTITAGNDGWFLDLADTGEQTVTSSVIFGGTVFFSTNHAQDPLVATCGTNLGEAKGYAVNLLNASGVIGSGGLCGGTRSGVFTGGGLPPSPVVGTVPVRQPDGTMKPISVLIGGINLAGNTSSPIGAQQPPVPIKQIRSRIYWYKKGDS